MDVPFPGMDPYLEAPGLWPDVHSSMIYAIRDQIQRRLSPQYVAVITPYVVFESLEIAPVRMAAVPAVSVVERPARDEEGVVAVEIDPAPIVDTVHVGVPTRYARLEIRSVDGDLLVTAIELLSPANKRPGQDGAEAYEKKRQEIFLTQAHLLEIDLLRAGRRPRVSRADLSVAPYFIFLSRAERRPNIYIWPASFRTAFPIVAVPLLRPDPDVALDLGACLRQIYASARYERRIDYRTPPPPPELAPADLAWIDARLRERDLRP